MEQINNFGLGFSGGGYRAATYHVGTLRGLHKLGLLGKVNVIATNSGGSIAGAYYTLNSHKPFPEFEKEYLLALKKNTILYALFHPRVFLGFLILIGAFIGPALLMIFWSAAWGMALFLGLMVVLAWLQFWIFPISQGIAYAYKRIFFGNACLKDLPDQPILVMNSTNIETGKLWSFSKSMMGDSSYEFNSSIQFKTEEFPLSLAVNASSCVPFAFSPVPVSEKFYVLPAEANKIHPSLMDGAVYDDQGIHNLTQDNSRYNCRIVLVSDAEPALPWQSNQKNMISLLLRTVQIVLLRVKNLQMISSVFQNATDSTKQRQIGYFSIAWDPQSTPAEFVKEFKSGLLTQAVIDDHQLRGRETEADESLILFIKQRLHWDELQKDFPTQSELELARKVGLNLTPLSQKQTDALIKHADVMTRIYVRLYCPALFA